MFFSNSIILFTSVLIALSIDANDVTPSATLLAIFVLSSGLLLYSTPRCLVVEAGACFAPARRSENDFAEGIELRDRSFLSLKGTAEAIVVVGVGA